MFTLRFLSPYLGGVFPLKPFEERNVELKSSSEFSKIWTPNSLSRGVS